jgi:hypothetical protein
LKDSSIFAQGISELLSSNATNISTSLSPTPTFDNPVSSPTSFPDASLSFSNDTDTYCFNTLDTINSSFRKCEDDTVLCSSDPQVAANCCKCKPDCCQQCNHRNSALDTDYPSVCPDDTSGADAPLLPLHNMKPISTFTVQTFLYGLVVFLSIFLLIRKSRQHDSELQALRIQQQQRRQDSQTAEELQRDRKQQILNKFHFTTIVSYGRNVFSTESVRSLKQTDSATDLRAEEKKDIEGDSEQGLERTTDNTENESEKQSSFFAFWRKQEAKEDVCSICLDRYRSGDAICVAKASGCDHVFHHDCVSGWLKSHDHCPLCRTDLMS